jgi:dolichyl-phosphate-mannose-protein mannosyltransferase
MSGAIYQRTLQSKAATLAPAETSRVNASPSLTKESDADARLRERELNPANWPKREEQLAFGGRRRAGTSGKLRKREWYILGVVCVLAGFVRLWKLHHPSSVVWVHHLL